ncbi:hypothetical protein AB0N29_19700 [Nocardioides sp. NPDC092400]|uniref:hypothetical protein n=1 Tax=Nocardioides sp. NPDC092400 TaxID=3155196 RepID=UPI003442A9D0
MDAYAKARRVLISLQRATEVSILGVVLAIGLVVVGLVLIAWDRKMGQRLPARVRAERQTRIQRTMRGIGLTGVFVLLLAVVIAVVGNRLG